MKIARVILDIQSNAFSQAFNYVVCDKEAENTSFNCLRKELMNRIVVGKNKVYGVEIGSIVVVPFGKQFKTAFVIDMFEYSKFDYSLDYRKLKPILLAISKPYFNFKSVEFAKFISSKYLCSFASALRLFMPSGVTTKLKYVNGKYNILVPSVDEVDDNYIVRGPNYHIYKPRANAVKQKLILDVLKNGEVKNSELNKEYGNTSQTINSLIKAGAIQLIKRRRIRNVLDSYHFTKKPQENFILTDGQRNAYECVNEAIINEDFKVYVLDGVTGSGKTEVYLRLINNVLEKGQTALVLVPEIALTPQILARFRNRFGDSIAVLHSKMSAGERFDQWDFIKSGDAKLVIGARSALFCPLDNIGLIVVDEEHENSYKQDKNPRYLTRTCAEFLAKQQNAVLILGSATPSIESLYNCNAKDNWERLVLKERTNKKPMPKISIVDMANEFKGGSKSIFSYSLSQAICRELKLNHKIVLFHNRRGFANYVFCRNCGYKPTCPNCSINLTYHERLLVDDVVNGQDKRVYKEMLFCHHCGHMEHAPVKCPECGSPYIAKLGAGTQSVEDQLNALLKYNDLLESTNIVRMDADTTRSKFGHQNCLESFAKPGAAVLLGTQMIAKGLDFDDVTLVGIVLVDTNLSLPDFRSQERTFDLILQVAGRAGRANLPGEVIVQTYNPENESVAFAANYDRESFLDVELYKRRALRFPPFIDLTNIIISGYVEEDTKNFANTVYDILENFKHSQNLSALELLSPTPCVLSKLRGQFRFHILIKSDHNCDISYCVSSALKGIKTPSKITMSIDIEPQNLM